jgi:hypothetical protein
VCRQCGRDDVRTKLLCATIGILFVIAAPAFVPRRMGAQEAAGEQHAWKTYTNVRFQYSICYPEDLLSPQGEAENSDGQKFIGRDGAQLIVFGSNNALNQSLKERLSETSARLAGRSGKVTYQAVKPKWFVVSGVNGPAIFYAKVFFSREQFKSFELSYSPSSAAIYKPLMAKLAGCFTDLAQ